jgi:hypothetical protein
MAAGPRPWLDHWLRVQREFEILQDMYAGRLRQLRSQDVQNNVNNFFIGCYQLKDHIKRDSAVLTPAKRDVEQYVHKTSALTLAGDIANTVKHNTLTSGRSAQISGWKTDQSGATAEITADNGTVSTTYDALVLAQDAMNAWRKFIAKHSLA